MTDQPYTPPPIDQAQLDALAEFLDAFGPTLTAITDDLERIVGVFRAACHAAYRANGAPYGDTDEGLSRWMNEARDEELSRWIDSVEDAGLPDPFS